MSSHTEKVNVFSLKTIEEKMFSTEDITKVSKVLKSFAPEGRSSLKEKEFVDVLVKLYPEAKTKHLKALLMKINSTSQPTVDMECLLNYYMAKTKVQQKLEYHLQMFPNPFQIIQTGLYKRIVRMLCIPSVDMSNNLMQEKGRPYQSCQYLTVTVGGTIMLWKDRFQESITFPLMENVPTPLPHSNKPKTKVTDMIYMKELGEVVIATTKRELIFFYSQWKPADIWVKNSVIITDNKVTALDYWSNGEKVVFCFGTDTGSLCVFTVDDYTRHRLFHPNLFQKVPRLSYPIVYLQTLLNSSSLMSKCIQIQAFNDACTSVRYFHELNAVALCGASCERMPLISLSTEADKFIYTRDIFSTDGLPAFSCVEFCSLSKCLVTGGTDGVVRIWSPSNPQKCILELQAQDKKITHLVYNVSDRIILSASEDMKVAVWKENEWMCTEIHSPEGMSIGKLSAVTYNKYNNELVLANSDIACCLGRGTDVFQREVTSHLKPVCSIIYHPIFNQVVSVSLDGIVTVWEMSTGEPTMQFHATRDDTEGHTCLCFDETQRQLVTVSPDGKVRMWNFNSGEKMCVFSLTLPDEPTAAICRGHQLFIAVKDDPNIFVLDMDTDDCTVFSHPLLEDVVALETWNEKVIAASSNGNVVLWEGKNYAKYCIVDGTRAVVLKRQHQGHAKGHSVIERSSMSPEEKKRTSILTFKTRKESHRTATMLVESKGYIYAWSAGCVLLGKFKAVAEDDAFITCWSTDTEEKTLLTGDSTGRVCLWDIRGFAIEDQETNGTKLRDVSLSPPTLLMSWRAEENPVTAAVCNKGCKNVITTGRCCNLTVFTKKGVPVGVFGKKPWDEKELQAPNIPPVVKKPTPQAKQELPDINLLFEEIEDNLCSCLSDFENKKQRLLLKHERVEAKSKKLLYRRAQLVEKCSEREKQYKQITENIPEAIYEINPWVRKRQPKVKKVLPKKKPPPEKVTLVLPSLYIKGKEDKPTNGGRRNPPQQDKRAPPVRLPKI